MAIIFGCVALLCLATLSQCVDPPVYSGSYKTEAVIRLPYAEIVEPIHALYDPRNNRSRIDYYGGVQVSIQLGIVAGYPNGTQILVIPFTTQTVYNQLSCFQVNGTGDSPMTITSVLPVLTGFTFIGEQFIEGRKTNAFQSVVVVGKKTSTYTFWSSTDNNQPIRYEMMGYDSLLGSHFDKYVVDYLSWQSPAEFRDADFSIPRNLTCTGFPGPGLTHTNKILMNPVQEYIHNSEEHVHESFEHFKATHKKQYSHDEHDSRKHVFRQNLRYIHSKNRAGLSYQMAVNHLADRTDKEMKVLRGYRHTKGDRGGKKYSHGAFTQQQSVPDQWDWRLIGAVTPVKDQAICGSCWSFGTTGTIEGANFLKTGNLIRLSQQELMDCSWGEGNNGCDGGEDFRSYKYLLANSGLTSEAQYGQYLAIDSFCKSKEVTAVVQISNYTDIPQGNLTALKFSIFNQGPISVGIDASHKSFGFYSSGVYFEPDCKNDPDDLDHAVLAVGYGTLYGQDYWLVKNSWSTYWGNDGYILMSQKDNNCGVATAATFVEIA